VTIEELRQAPSRCASSSTGCLRRSPRLPRVSRATSRGIRRLHLPRPRQARRRMRALLLLLHRALAQGEGAEGALQKSHMTLKRSY
jgi:hypothetical protein